jgi:hypothetical protein
MADLKYYRSEVVRAGGDPQAVEAGVTALVSAPFDQWPALMSLLDVEADKLPFPFDRDFLAVCLESVAEQRHDPRQKRFLLECALNRATWCASCATAGGEGLARSIHVHALEAKLKALGSR